MSKYLILFFCFIGHLSFTQELVLSSDSLVYNFKKDWRFSPEINGDFSGVNLDDSKWTVIQSIENSRNLRKLNFTGSGWFRIKFRVDTSLVNTPLAFMYNFDGASELYLDGKLFKQYGKIKGNKNTESYNPKEIPEPFIIGDTATHLIALKIKYFDEDPSNWSIFELSVGTSEKMIEHFTSEAIAITLIVSFLGVIFLTLGIIHLFFFLYYRHIVSNLFFSLFMLGLSAVMTISMYLYIINDPNEISRFSDILFNLIPFLTLAFTAFIHYIFYEKSKVWIIAITSLAILSFLLINLETDLSEIIVLLLVMISMLHGLFRIVVSLFKKQPGAWIIGTGILFSILFSFFVVAVGFTGTVNINTENLSGQLLVLGVLLAIISIPLSMSIYQAWSFSKLNKDLGLQLIQVKDLSEKTIQQELEKQHILENQKEVLEIKVEERTQQLLEEKKKSDDLLLNILPHEVAEELKEKGFAEAKLVDQVTVIFTDFKGFTSMAEKLSPQELVHDIHECFSAFDRIMSKYGIEKIKTIGDAYMAASGLPSPSNTHASDAVKAALEMAAFIEDGKALKIAKSLPYFEIRIGVHSGPVVAGIVGIKKFAYDIWGDTVNTASRMESSGEIGKVNISETTYEFIKNDYQCAYRGEIDAKGKGKVKMYFVEKGLS